MTRRLLLVWLMAVASLAAAEVLPVRFYDAEKLSSNMITSLCQDQQGYIWIGTEYGLNKFDGVNVTQYYHDDDRAQSLVDNIVRRMMIDRRGILWVVCNRGVQRYNRMTDGFETVNFGDNATVNVNDLLETPSGAVWMLSSDGGIYEVAADGLEARRVEAINRHVNGKESCDNMLLDSKGRLWIGYRGNVRLQMIDTRTGRSRYYDEALLPNNRAVDVIEDGRHRLLVLTYSGVLMLNEQTQHFEPVAEFPRNSVHHIYAGTRGRLYIGTTGSGLWLLDVDRHELDRTYAASAFQTQDVDISKARVHAFLEDRSGNLWLGCHERGLLLVSKKSHPFHFMALSQMEHNNGNGLRSVFTDSKGRGYVCQVKGGITEIDHQGRSLGHWMGDYTVNTLFEEQNGTLLAGTYRNGLFRVNLQTGSEQPLPLTAGQRISCIVRDRQGNLYTAAFNNGLHSYTPDGLEERPLGKGQLQLTNLYLNTLFIDRQGLVWIGHYYGIDVYNPQTDRLVTLELPAALRPAIVYAIGQSPKDHSVWIGSDRGLFQYYTEGREKGQWKRFTTKDGLPNDIVCSLVMTHDGTIWAGTYRGLAQIEPNGRFTRYYRGNGLEEWSYLRGVYSHSALGEVVLGNQDGITYFIPEKIVKDEFRQGLMLTGMRLGNADVNVSTLSNGHHIITKAIDTADDITVSYYDNTFSLRFSPMDFRDAQNMHYEFRFVGEAGGQWHQTELGRSEIFLSHLSAGSHKLQVRAYDNGVYSAVKTLTLHVLPPWYRTWWAYLCYLLLVAAVGMLWWRNYWNRRQAETNEEKIRFFVDISHELRSPLTLIKNPLDALLKRESDPSTRRALQNMERNTDRLLTLVNQILSIRKIEKGQMTLHYAETDLQDFVAGLCHNFDLLAERRHIVLSFSSTADGLRAWIDRDNFDKVVNNLISNAFKYVDDSGRVDVVLARDEQRDGYCTLTVRDDGPGIDEGYLKKVFDRFYQTSARPTAGQMGYGIGLNLTRQLVRLHGGTIEARNRADGHGAEFVVSLPLGSAHLSKSQLVDDAYFLRSGEESAEVVAVDKPQRVRRKTNYRVAVVDDDDEIRQFLQTELGESYRVTTYKNGSEALAGITADVPDLVVSDVVMPVMDGFTLLHRLKSSTTTSHVPVILLTTRTEHQARIEGLEQGADAYLDKPFNQEELEARIAGLIANRKRVEGKFSGLQEQEGTVRQVELKGNDAVLMEKIMKAVNENFDDSDFNVEALADKVGLSRVQLHRRMKELTGMSVGDFIRNLRLQQAARLLEAGDTTVAQVTYAVGFANPTHFTTAFKRKFGVTPTEYMSRHAGKKD